MLNCYTLFTFLHDPLVNFGTPAMSLQSVKLYSHLKFRMQIDTVEYECTHDNDRLSSNGCCSGLRDV